MSLHSEILEQPQSIERLIKEGREDALSAAAMIQAKDPHYVFIAARGTSDNAGRYASYVWGAYNRLPVALGTPSLFTLYGCPPVLRNGLVVGISQSGKSPDIVSIAEEARKQGVPSLALVNVVNSPMGQACDMAIDLRAGPEMAVAATKSYTAQLTAVAMLSCAMEGKDSKRWDQLQKVPQWAEEILRLEPVIEELAYRFCFARHCVVLGRGYNYATAFEWSLKLKELSYTVADPYSTADFQHGPIALVEKNFPVLMVAPSGVVIDQLHDMAVDLRAKGAQILAVSDHQGLLGAVHSGIKLPAGIPEWLSPILAILPGQLFAYHLTRVRGLNTETPRSISKITETE